MIKNIMYFMDRFVSPPVSYPNRSHFCNFINFFKNIVNGKSFSSNAFRIIQFIIQFILAFLVTPIALILRHVCNFRFLSIDLSQIGSILFLDLFVRETVCDEGKLPKIFVCRSKNNDANSYIIDLYKHQVVFIENPVARFVLTPLFLNPYSRSNTFRYDFANIGDYSAYEVWNRFDLAFGGPLITMPYGDQQLVKEQLEVELPGSKKFVTLHVRDSGFYGDTGRTTRNADINNYVKAVRYLLEEGYSVIRAGDPGMVDAPDVAPARNGCMLFDYAHSPLRSEVFDAYLVSNCEFYVGLASGLASCVPLFGTNSCNVNYYAASSCLGYLKGDIASFKTFKFKDTGELLPLKELLNPPYSLNPQLSELDELGVELVENSPEDLLSTVQEFVNGRKGYVPSKRQIAAKKYLRKVNFSYGAQGDYGDHFLRQYDRFMVDDPIC